jgi:hypothetical protein
MRVELLQGAEADLLEAYIRLEEHGTGGGERFYRALDAALERLRTYPAMAPIYGIGDWCFVRSIWASSSQSR